MNYSNSNINVSIESFIDLLKTNNFFGSENFKSDLVKVIELIFILDDMYDDGANSETAREFLAQYLKNLSSFNSELLTPFTNLILFYEKEKELVKNDVSLKKYLEISSQTIGIYQAYVFLTLNFFSTSKYNFIIKNLVQDLSLMSRLANDLLDYKNLDKLRTLKEKEQIKLYKFISYSSAKRKLLRKIFFFNIKSFFFRTAFFFFNKRLYKHILLLHCLYTWVKNEHINKKNSGRFDLN